MEPEVGGAVRVEPIERLRLDGNNPRFADYLKSPSQPQLVNYLAEEVGLSDLLGSLSKGGYFPQSPLIAVEEAGSLTVVEGNRRLASVLILTGDPRASGQAARRANYPMTPEVEASLRTLPTLIAASRRAVLPYLGIAHIVGNKKWDSFAKAAWAASILDASESDISLTQIMEQIGDHNKTLARMVEAFRVIKQLQGTGRFEPQGTERAGRGTAAYPFSWLYTALGYESVRRWVGLEARENAESAQSKEPLPVDKLDAGSELLAFLFGQPGRPAVVGESREISELAAALSDARQSALLRVGRSLKEAVEEVRPSSRRILEGLLHAGAELRTVLGLMPFLEPSDSELAATEREADQVRRVAVEIQKRLREILFPPESNA